MTLSRNRARKRHGLGTPSLGATLARVLVPIAVVVGFIYMMNSYELAPGVKAGIPVPVIIFLAVAAGRRVSDAEHHVWQISLRDWRQP